MKLRLQSVLFCPVKWELAKVAIEPGMGLHETHGVEEGMFYLKEEKVEVKD